MLKYGRITILCLVLANGVGESLAQAASEASAAGPVAAVRNAPHPGGEAALRRLLAEVANGKPDYELLTPAMATALREQLPTYQQELLALGQLNSVTFANATPDGADIFDVRMANGSLKCMIRLDTHEKVAVADCRQAALPPL